MFDILKKIIRFKIKEFEAKLRPTPECTFGGIGEIEVSWYSGGEVEVEFSLKRSKVSEGTKLEFYGDGSLLGVTTANSGYTKCKEIVTNSQVSISKGSTAELRIDGAVLYRGEFLPD